MLGSVVAQDVIDPVHSPVHRVAGLVLVDLRQPPRPLPVARGAKPTRKKGKAVISCHCATELPEKCRTTRNMGWFCNKPFPPRSGVSPKTLGFSPRQPLLWNSSSPVGRADRLFTQDLPYTKDSCTRGRWCNWCYQGRYQHSPSLPLPCCLLLRAISIPRKTRLPFKQEASTPPLQNQGQPNNILPANPSLLLI